MSKEFYGDLSIICTKGSEGFIERVDEYIKDWRGEPDKTYIVDAKCPRFSTGEGKGIIMQTMRGHDTYIYADCFNHGASYDMYGTSHRMSPDDHFADLKRIIGAVGGKARRITVIMPMLYEGRQHRRMARESLDCAIALQDLANMGVSNIITFDAHDPRVQNSVPLSGFDNIQPTYQMLKALVKNVDDISFSPEKLTIVSPDEGAMHRCIFYSSVLGVSLGMFYKRRNYSVIVDGRNPIEAHEYLGKDLHGKDVIVVDDMISSGDSMLDITAKLKDIGARRIFIFATFGLFTNGLDRFDDMYEKGLIDKVFTTNLIYRSDELLSRPWYCETNVCKYVSLIIDTLNRDLSLNDILDPVDKIHNLMDRVKYRV